MLVPSSGDDRMKRQSKTTLEPGVKPRATLQRKTMSVCCAQGPVLPLDFGDVNHRHGSDIGGHNAARVAVTLSAGRTAVTKTFQRGQLKRHPRQDPGRPERMERNKAVAL